MSCDLTAEQMNEMYKNPTFNLPTKEQSKNSMKLLDALESQRKMQSFINAEQNKALNKLLTPTK